MSKVAVPNAVFSALPVVIAGSMSTGQVDFATFGCFGMLCLHPHVHVYIGSGRSHQTNVGVGENGVYSINVPSVDLLEKTDYAGLVSGHRVDKSSLFTIFFGTDDKAPMIEECHFNAVCQVVQTIEVGTNDVFIGEIVEAFVDGDCMSEDGHPDLARIRPLLLSVFPQADRYWDKGEPVGEAFGVGRGLIDGPAATPSD